MRLTKYIGWGSVTIQNTVASISEPLTIKHATSDVPELRPREVLVEVEIAGICGTDLEIFDGSLNYIKSGRIAYPIVPGHEFYGEIVAVGSEVANFKVGDKVSSEIHIGCGACEACRRGRYNLCQCMQRLGIGDLPGAMARYVVAPERFLHKIPPELSAEQAVLLEPMSVGSLCAVSR